MNDIFDSKRFWMVTWILGTIVVAKLLWVVAQWLIPLPLHGVEQEKTSLRHSLHYRYHLASDSKLKVPKKDAEPKTPPRASLSSYKLVAIYGHGDYAMATLTKGSKSFFLTNDIGGGDVEGYHLKEVNTTAATFKRGDEKAVLRLFDKKKGAASHAIEAPATQTAPQKLEEKKPTPKIVDNGDTKQIDRSLIREYTENPDKIWKNIGLYEVKHDGKLDGFKVRFVRKNSAFEQLGLKRGDVIKAINGEPIVDYATPMRMLRSADTIDDLSLTIERNHEEQELKYEVK